MADEYSIGVRFEDRTATGARSAARNIDRVTQSADRMHRSNQTATTSLQSAGTAMRTAAGAASALGASLAVAQVMRYADAWTNATNRLKQAATTARQLYEAQESVHRIAQETRSDFNATANLYARLARSTEDLGATQQDLHTVTRAINEAFIVSGASATEAAAAVMQLGQGLASGTLRGDELRSVMEQAPRLARAIAAGLDVSIGQLRELGTQGELTARAVFGALREQAEAIHGEFEATNATFGQAFTTFGNSVERLVGRLNEMTGAGDAATQAILHMAAAVEGMTPGVQREAPSAAEMAGDAQYGAFRPSNLNRALGYSRMLMGDRMGWVLMEQAAKQREAENARALQRLQEESGLPMDVGGAGPGEGFGSAEHTEFMQGLRDELREARRARGEQLRAEVTAAINAAYPTYDAATENLRAGMRGPAPFAGYVQAAGTPRMSTQRAHVGSLELFPRAELQTWLDDVEGRVGQLSDALGGLSPRLQDFMGAARKGTEALRAAMTGDIFGAVVYSIGAVTTALGAQRDESERTAAELRRAAEAMRRMRQEAAQSAQRIGGEMFDDVRRQLTEPFRALFRQLHDEQMAQPWNDPGDPMDVAFSQANAIRRVLESAAVFDSADTRRDSALTDTLRNMGMDDWDQREWRVLTETIFGVEDIADVASEAFTYLADSLEESSRAASKLADVELSLHYDALEMGLRQQAAGAYRQAGADVGMQARAYHQLMQGVADLRAQEQARGRGATSTPTGGSGAPGGAEGTPGAKPADEQTVVVAPQEPVSLAELGVDSFADLVDLAGVEPIPVSVTDIIELPDGAAFDAYYQTTWLPAITGTEGFDRYRLQALQTFYRHRAQPSVHHMVRLPTARDFQGYYERTWLPAMHGTEGFGRYRLQMLQSFYRHRTQPNVHHMVRLPTARDFQGYYERAWLPAMHGTEGFGRYRLQMLQSFYRHRAQPSVHHMVRLPSAVDFQRYYERAWLPAMHGTKGINRYRLQMLQSFYRHRAQPGVTHMVKLPSAVDFQRYYERAWLPAMHGTKGIERYRLQMLFSFYRHRAQPGVTHMVKLPSAVDFQRYYERAWLPAMHGTEGVGRYAEQWITNVVAHKARPGVEDLVALPTAHAFTMLYARGDTSTGRLGDGGLLDRMWGQSGHTVGDYLATFRDNVRAHRVELALDDLVTLGGAIDVDIDFNAFYQWGLMTVRPAQVPLSQIVSIEPDTDFTDALIAAVEDAVRNRQTTPGGWSSY